MIAYARERERGDPARGVARFDPPLGHLAARVQLDVDSVAPLGRDWRVIARIRHEEK